MNLCLEIFATVYTKSKWHSNLHVLWSHLRNFRNANTWLSPPGILIFCEQSLPSDSTVILAQFENHCSTALTLMGAELKRSPMSIYKMGNLLITLNPTARTGISSLVVRTVIG